MEHTKLSRLLLCAGGIAIIGIICVFVFLLPAFLLSLLPVTFQAPIFWCIMVSLWGIAALYLWAMREYLAVCRRIGTNRCFCRENVRSLTVISRLLWLSAAGWMLPPVLCAVAGNLMAIIWESLLCAMAGLALGILAYALARLLLNAVELQEENDLTI